MNFNPNPSVNIVCVRGMLGRYDESATYSVHWLQQFVNITNVSLNTASNPTLLPEMQGRH